MLEFKLTPQHAGITLWGDFAALDQLHEFIHHVVAESDYIEALFGRVGSHLAQDAIMPS